MSCSRVPAAAGGGPLPGRDRQVLGQDHAAPRHHHGALDRRSRARARSPASRSPSAGRAPRWRWPRSPSSAAYFAEEVLDQQRDVLAPLAQRRQRERDDVQPVVEVLAEAPVARSASSRSRLVAATTRTSTRIGLAAADALELAAPGARAAASPAARAACRRSRRGRACRRGPARSGRARRCVRAGEGARARGRRARSRAASRGMRRAVDRDERPARAPAVVVDGARHELLAGARLAARASTVTSRRRRRARSVL